MRFLLALAVILTASTALPAEKKVRYDNYKVFRIVPKTEQELSFIQKVTSKFDRLDFWKSPSKVGNPVDVMVSPVDQESFLASLAQPDLDIDIMIPDVQQLIDEEAAKMADITADVAGFDYFKYHTMDEISAWMDDFVAENAPDVTKIAVSTTYLGETVYGLRIQKQPGSTNVAYFQGGIHAREWISPATMINYARQFMEGYGTDDDITSMLDNFVWIIVPVYNVDGYRFSHTNDRMWRKNRNDNNNGNCKGVDLNRNFDYEWGGASNFLCAEDYQGTSALSEPENYNAKDFLLGFGDNLKLYIDFHAYGLYWLYPYGYTRVRIPHAEKDAQHDLAVKVETAIKAVYGTDFLVGESGPDMYPATGASEDFGYGSLGVKYSYVVELRDEGQYGFILPEDQIQPVSEEMIAGMIEVGKQLVTEYV